MDYIKQIKKVNRKLIVIGLIMSLLPFVGMFLCVGSMVKTAMQFQSGLLPTEPADETFGGFGDDASFTFDDEGDGDFLPDVEQSEGQSAEESQIPEFDDFGTADDIDYNTSSGSTFDDSFVSEPIAGAEADAWQSFLRDAEIGGSAVEYSTDLIPVSDHIFELTNFESKAGSLAIINDSADWNAFEDSCYAMEESFDTSAITYLGFCITQKDAVYTLKAAYFSETGFVSNVEQVLSNNTDSARAEFNKEVCTVIDNGDLVLVTLIPTQLDTATTPRTLFNRFDDKVSADVPTNVLDWYDFEDVYTEWLTALGDVDSLGFYACKSGDSNTNYKAVAFNTNGERIDDVTFVASV